MHPNTGTAPGLSPGHPSRFPRGTLLVLRYETLPQDGRPPTWSARVAGDWHRLERIPVALLKDSSRWLEAGAFAPGRLWVAKRCERWPCDLFGFFESDEPNPVWELVGPLAEDFYA